MSKLDEILKHWQRIRIDLYNAKESDKVSDENYHRFQHEYDRVCDFIGHLIEIKNEND